jgi:hypothetical protein
MQHNTDTVALFDSIFFCCKISFFQTPVSTTIAVPGGELPIRLQHFRFLYIFMCVMIVMMHIIEQEV